MKTTQSFDLISVISDWRSDLASSGSLTKEDLDELESHMLDEMDQLTRHPLSQKEAFLVARERIGSRSDLSQPYIQSKSPWTIFMSRSNLYLQALLALIIISLTTRIVEFVVILTVASFELPMIWGSYLYAGLLTVLLLAIFVGLRFVHHRARKRSQRVSLTGNLTMMTLFVSIIAVLFGTQFVGAPIPLEIMSIFIIRQYIWIVGFAAVFVTSVVYSIRDIKSLRVKRA
ncbi:MAG: hypothetical protein HEP71_14885 [Roseivirga sp.]|nr:hypothetical protein [Roseivirga sp.]